jgi:rare lipoprotein A
MRRASSCGWINDRGPFVKGRIIDLSHAAAKKIGMVEAGVVRVEIVVVK